MLDQLDNSTPVTDRRGDEQGEFDHEHDRLDAVVIGSGFGGAVAAWRLLTECPGAQILVLERGLPYPPGSFARRPREMRRNFWDPDGTLFGLFEVWSFTHAKTIVASGLGGGSLIYANVMLPKPSATFTVADRANGHRPWPIDERAVTGRYEDVEEMLGATELPDEYVKSAPEGSRAVVKTQQFIDAARAAGLTDASPARLAISFGPSPGSAEPGASLGAENLHNRTRRSCTLVGECDLGCNEGAKNTLDYNYLTEFQRLGGHIRTCCEALTVAPVDGGYSVRYRQHGDARAHVLARARAERQEAGDGRLLDPLDAGIRRVQARVVVLAAGTLGSTRLLLTSRASLPRLSPALGSRFSSNGDLVTFARGCREPGTDRVRDLAPSRGPVITAYARGGVPGGELWMEDAGGPLLSEWGWQAPEVLGDALKALREERSAPRRGAPRARLSALIAHTFGEAGSSAGMLPLLTMGRDVPGGQLSLDGPSSLSLDWNPADSEDYFSRAETTAAAVAARLGGSLGPRLLRRRTRGVTVHPLGGCPMASDRSHGVVDSSGEVFGYRGLFVADGSVMPGPVGPNPSLTIAAMADHIATAAARQLCDANERRGV